MLIAQGPNNPAAMRHALVEAMSPAMTRIRIASAYMSTDGFQITRDACFRHVGSFEHLPKIVVTSLDFGITSPAVLRRWIETPNTTLLIASPSVIESPGLNPRTSAFHPKMYGFDFPDGTSGVLVGSANLTGRGFSANSESAWSGKVPTVEFNRNWDILVQDCQVATIELIGAYELARTRVPRSPVAIELEPVARNLGPSRTAESMPVFSTAAVSGYLMPSNFDQFWAQVSTLQGGSRNQLELPRGAHRFFGFTFRDYDASRVEQIGRPRLVSGRHVWSDRPLTWHGDNRMERINLPTLAQGGFVYSDSAIMFRKLSEGTYELIVEPWGSDIANSWVNASAESGQIFRLGQNTTRLAGFI